MKRVITYGTFDMLHYGHINLLKRAKALGDYLIVVLSTDEFNWSEKQKVSYQEYDTRKYILEAIRYVDLVVPEQSWEDKALYIDMFDVDVFAMGDDWRGKFDVLKEQFPNLKTMYFPRGKTSSSKIKEDLWKLYQEKQNIK